MMTPEDVSTTSQRDSKPTKTTFDRAVDMIATEAGCESTIAKAFLTKIQVLVCLMRECGYEPLPLTSDLFDERELAILTAVLPHIYTPTIGSVQEAIEYAVLDFRRGEYALQHMGRWHRTCALRVMVGTH